ncbi:MULTISPECIES: hypothetical protein [Streptomyces]|uniref:Uncharacterized protein n=1 Tax=Streptomyces morookaense TaxID=1970 RepID=A0A7Y7B5T9_STRMO|nr:MULTISPECIES: hypothetical protein [Streptomyces]MCC2279676.1 hypothetical protein [Streptomyces sp. ET3-23]NVK79573.1 hypothetical protein [Streptomyces morookaense]
MDLLDWHRGALSSRRLMVLVKHMPRDSAVNRDLHGEAVEWDASTHLVAAAVDHLAVANWMTATINGGEDGEPLDYPEPVPRPLSPDMAPAVAYDSESATPLPEQPTPSQLAAFFG